jgi:riboflavin kinase/FMN adenylyltransferase
VKVYRSVGDLPKIKNAVVTIGSFDGVHLGHKKILHRINQLSREIEGESVVVTFNPHPRQIIYPKDTDLSLLTSLDEKIKLFEKNKIDHLLIIPFTVEFSQQAPREYIEKFIIKVLNPSYVVIGYDHRFGLNRVGNFDLLKMYEKKGDFKVLEIEKQEIEDITISSTKIRNAIRAAEMINANSLLGYHYLLTGKVIHGQKIGKGIGFPTANLKILEKHKQLPPDGIYAVFVQIDEESFQGMLYIGKRPTLKNTEERSIEVNIFDFKEDIYGKEIQLEIVMYIRDDRSFEDLEALRLQLINDKESSLYILEKYTTQSEVDEKTAVVLLNYNGRELLESYLPSILYSSNERFKLYVADNYSTDSSIEFLQEWYPEVNIISFTKNYGFALGYNKAIQEISHPYTVLLNTDVLVTENWLDPIIEMMEKDETIAACQPKIKSLLDQKQFEYAGAAGGYMDTLAYPFCAGRVMNHVEEDSGQYDENSEVFWVSGAAMVIRTDVFRNFGGFDPDFFAHQEEIDLCWRLKNAGYSLMYCADSTVYHLGGGTLDYDNPQKHKLNFRNNLACLYKNETKNRWIKLGFRFILDHMATILFLMQGKVKHALAVLGGIYAFYGKLSYWKDQRVFNQKINNIFKIGPPKVKGRYRGMIIFDYYIRNVKLFSNLSKRKFK